MKRQRAGALRHSVAFDAETETPDDYGGQDIGWSEVHNCRAEFRYQKGDEAVQAGALTGTATFKVRIRVCAAARGLTAEHRMRDVRANVAYNIREVDVVSDRRNVWLVVESGVAV